jgi:UDP-glucose 4-epimerase
VLFEAMREARVVSIVFSSTCTTHGLPAQVPMREQNPQEPINPYAESRLVVEKCCGGVSRRC